MSMQFVGLYLFSASKFQTNQLTRLKTTPPCLQVVQTDRFLMTKHSRLVLAHQ